MRLRGFGLRFGLGALGAALLCLPACNSSNPVAPDAPPPTGNTPFTVTIASNPSTLAVGATTPATITVTVRRNDNNQPPPDGTQVSLNTSLGSFGSGTATTPVQLVTLTLSKGTAQTSLFPGSATGTAQLLAQVEQSIGQLAVPIQTVEQPAFFLLSISPNFGNAFGGQTVTITGSGIQAPVRVTFGTAVARVGTVTSTTIQATVPASTQPVAEGSTLAVNVAVTNALGQSGSTTDTLTSAWTYSGGDVQEPVAVFSVTPSSGPNAGGTPVTITGNGFISPVQVLFGISSGGSFQGFAATVQSATSTTIHATTPSATGVGLSLANQLVSVQVRNVNTGDTAVGTGVFSYTGAGLFVTSMSPTSGPYTGGTPVTIQGSGFAGTLQVQFGGSVQTLRPSTGTQLNVITVPVTVSNCQPPSGTLTVRRLDTGDVAMSAINFTYTAPTPNISSLSPASGAQGGGNTVTLQGTGFDSSARVTINGAAATVSSAQASSIVVTAPAFGGTFDTETCTDSHNMQGKRNKPKAVDVAVTSTATGCSDTLPMSYTYQPDDTSCVVTPPPKPKADFTFEILGLMVAFNDVSSNSPTSRLWDFGDPSSGTANTSTAASPTHTYASVMPGQTKTFSVTLNATNAGGTDTVVKFVTVTAPP